VIGLRGRGAEVKSIPRIAVIPPPARLAAGGPRRWRLVSVASVPAVSMSVGPARAHLDVSRVIDVVPTRPVSA
jgi:hypothetical protein